MKHLLTILLLTCATSFAQSVIVKATGAGAVWGTGAGSVRGVVVPPAQTITNFPNPGTQYTNSTVELWAQASSGLDVTNFAVAIGPGTIAGLTNLTFTGAGTVSVTADQLGDADWAAAPTVTNTFEVKDRGTETTYSANRFSVWSGETNIVVDNDSGLTWTRNANIAGTKDWTNAMAYCDNLTNATRTDWRLPSFAELSRDELGATNGLVDAYDSANNPALPLGHPFANVQATNYWSSSTFLVPPNIWIVDLYDGWIDDQPKVNMNYVWPCRGP